MGDKVEELWAGKFKKVKVLQFQFGEKTVGEKNAVGIKKFVTSWISVKLVSSGIGYYTAWAVVVEPAV